jgi:phenylalanyl-tRNA synthetase beta chain
MKFSYNWLREFVPGLTQAAAPLEELITIKTAECEGIEEVGALLAEATAVHVQTVEPIAGSHAVKATLDNGKTVVCGAPNCRAGMTSIYVPVGKKVVHGVESDGMLASAAELGINKDHTGIVEIGALDRLRPDSIIEIDNKSITHRPDLWGHHGMAREVAAILELPLTDPARLDILPPGPAVIKIQIEDLNLCPRYSALVFEGIKVGPSPLWLQYRLSAIGLNPINNIVDMTNYVMAELAQPMHAFDADLLKGDTIFIRPAKPGEPFKALNDESYTLDASNLVIADSGGAIALAGVIGGADSAIGGNTTRVVLESANFQASSIRKTSAAIKLRTDASMRFEKAQDPKNTARGLARAIELLRETCPTARLVGGVADQVRESVPPPPIELPLEWLERKLGRAIPAAEVRRILESLSFSVNEPRSGVFSVTVPSWRATKDVSIKDDLVEEVGRMIGYGSITPQAPLLPSKVPPGNPTRRFHHEVRDIFVDNGYTEVYNYSFLSEDAVRAFGFDPAEHIRVANPIASDQALMRRSLLPGLWTNVVENAKHRDNFRIFEVGLQIEPAQAGGLPGERAHLVAAVYAREGDGAAALFEVKRIAECLMPGVAVLPSKARNYEHPARAAYLLWKPQEPVGRIFELHPSLIKTGRAAILDIDLQSIEPMFAREIKYTPIRRFPTSSFDLSIVAQTREPVGLLREHIVHPLVTNVEFVRQYSGPPLPEGSKSATFRVTVGSADRTLSNDDITAVRAALTSNLRSQGYEFRE